MGKLVYGMNVSLDGFVDHDKFAPGPELFRHFIKQTRKLGGSLYGRRLYELMAYWDGDDWDQEGHNPDHDDLREFALTWRAQPKWVVSNTLTSVGPNATLVRGDDLEGLVARLKSEIEGRIDVGGTKLAQSLKKLGLIDEYQMYLHPVVLGSGTRFFPAAAPPLRLLATDRVGEEVVRLTYAPV